MISDYQSAFSKGCQIIDDTMLANEIIHNMRCKLHNDGGIILKLDSEKAFGCVDWGYRPCVMQAIGFRQKWCN